MTDLPTRQPTDREKLTEAFKRLRTKGYCVVWKRSSGYSEYDVPEGQAGFDIRFNLETRNRKPSFSAEGKLLDRLYVGWGAGVTTGGEDKVDGDAMWWDFVQAITDAGFEAVPMGATDSHSWAIQPKFERRG